MDACQTPARQQSEHHRGQKCEGEDERNGENEEKEKDQGERKERIK